MCATGTLRGGYFCPYILTADGTEVCCQIVWAAIYMRASEKPLNLEYISEDSVARRGNQTRISSKEVKISRDGNFNIVLGIAKSTG